MEHLKLQTVYLDYQDDYVLTTVEFQQVKFL